MGLEPRLPGRLRRDYVEVFSTPAGRRVLRDLYGFCHMAQPTFSPDPQIAAFNEGCRRVFLRILGLMRMSQDEIVTMATEMTDD